MFDNGIPSFKTETAVSSQEDSMARRSTGGNQDLTKGDPLISDTLWATFSISHIGVDVAPEIPTD
jgi:hypothetical protein